jgi:hypothetical protein
MRRSAFQVGDRVVYRKSKQSVLPGPRAQDVKPFEKGDGYSYVVEKFWVVAAVFDDGTLLLKTRRGKQHRVSPHDPALRRANWWQRLRHRARFEQIESVPEAELKGN